MSRRVQDNIVAVALAAVFVYVIVAGLGLGPRARMVPLPLAIFGLALVLVQIVWQNVRPANELKVDLLEVLTDRRESDGFAAAAEAAQPPETAAQRRSGWRGEALAFGIVALILALILALGPIPAVLLFTAGYFIATRHYNWRKSVVYTAAFTLTIYLLFFVALEVQPYHGVLQPLVDRLR